MRQFAFIRRVRTLVRTHRAELRFCIRMTTAGLLAFAIAQVLNIPLHGIWAVLTAVVVTQMSVGGSLRATIEYMVGTLGGAAYAGIIGLLVPHSTPLGQAGVLTLTIAPLAFAAARNQNFRVAPFSAVLVLLISGELGEGPIASAAARLFEVALGGVVAVAVSLVVFRQRAEGLAAEAAARVLQQMAHVLPKLLDGFTQHLDAADIGRMQDEIGGSLAHFQEIAAEASNESLVNFMEEPRTGPLSRTLLRLRHDIVIVGRAAVAPLPGDIARRLGPRLAHVSASAGDFLKRCGIALTRHTGPPPRDAVDAAVRDYMSETQSLRSEGLTMKLSNEEVERLFAVGFALDQMQREFADLERCVREQSRPAGR